MKVHKAVIYCRVDDRKEIKNQRTMLDTLFFRLQSYAHAHKISVVNYYEDISHTVHDHTNSGFMQLLFDSKNVDFDTILVASYDQIAHKFSQNSPFLILSLEVSERGAGISSLMNNFSL